MSFADLALLGAGWQVFCVVVVLVLGACLGSFMNCFAWRIVNGESILKGRSHCTTCNHELGPLDLVPILSWIFLRGKCRYCGAPVSVRYMLAELLCGLYFVSMVIAFGLSIDALFYMALGCVLLGLSLVDIDSMLIPNGFIIAGIVLWVVFSGLRLAGFAPVDPSDALMSFAFPQNPALAHVLDGLVAGVGVFIIMLVIVGVFGAVKGVAGMGMGDLKLFFMVSLWLGIPCTLLNLILSCVIGLIVAGVYASHAPSDVKCDNVSHQGSSSKLFPFGPSIALASWITLLCGSFIVNAYLSLLGF